MKKCHYFFFFFFLGSRLAHNNTNPKPPARVWNEDGLESEKHPKRPQPSGVTAQRSEEGCCERTGGAPMFFPVHSWPDSLCSSNTSFFFFFMRLWNRPRLSFPVNDFISSLDCCLGCGLVCIYFNYEQWKSALAARLVAPTGTKLFLLRRET